MTKSMPIFYFSGTGNTWWVGKRIEEALKAQGIEAEAISIENISPGEVTEKIGQAGMLGLGYPIHGSDTPYPMKVFINALPQQSEALPTMIYVTELAFSGDGASFLKGQLRKKGYDLRWAVEFKMPNNISQDLGGVINSLFKLIKTDLDKVNKKVEKLAERVASGKKWIQGGIPVLNMGWTQRIPFRMVFSAVQKNTWMVDPQKCSGCERCERICPVENITMQDGLPLWGDHCILCMRCANFCPDEAILPYKKTLKGKAFGEKAYRGPVPGFKPELLIGKKKDKTVG
ncbi:MAG: EFR1 family ferrodoxin [Anaerolineaceae bacterium]|nr:EFR1 family ferrodoxin [Anaerolineaceae bacterium]